MCLLRVKLMHFVNSLHNYIMTRVRGFVGSFKDSLMSTELPNSNLIKASKCHIFIVLYRIKFQVKLIFIDWKSIWKYMICFGNWSVVTHAVGNKLIYLKHNLWSLFTLSCQILHSTGLEFQHQVQEAKDLDQLIKIHYRYLATIHDRCLLREKVNSTLGEWH